MNKTVLSYRYIPFPGDEDFLLPRALIQDAAESNDPYIKYLCAWLNFDVDTTQGCSSILAQIEQLERGERELAYGGGNAWFVNIYRDHVDFELQTANDHPDWPIWKCSLAEVKTALIGWRKFLEMPKRLDSVMEVELPSSSGEGRQAIECE
jgi:hypothetical protein